MIIHNQTRENCALNPHGGVKKVERITRKAPRVYLSEDCQHQPIKGTPTLNRTNTAFRKDRMRSETGSVTILFFIERRTTYTMLAG